LVEGRILKKLYRITNVANQRIGFSTITETGEVDVDYLEIDEVVYGVDEEAVKKLKFYENKGLIRIEDTDRLNSKVHWLLEGF
jgi:hypothetical protein